MGARGSAILGAMTIAQSFTLGLLVLTSFVTPTRAIQLDPDAAVLDQLVRARSLKCTFPWYASVDWDAGEPTVRTAKQDFEFHIDGIDLKAGTARIVGNAGAADLAATRGDASVTFIEQVPSGAINLTSVFAWRDKGCRFKAVHSRHTAIGGPSPSQNYGFCQVW